MIGHRNNKRRRNDKQSTKIDEFEEKIIQIKRVSKKTKGGNTMRFTALAVVGNKNGSVGAGYGKGKDVITAITKSISQAKNEVFKVPIVNGTIPHDIKEKYRAAEVLLKPAPEGAGIIAGGSIRVVVSLAGIKDISAKMIGSHNKICNVRCTLNALKHLKTKGESKSEAKKEVKSEEKKEKK